jgi:hypothetical protein
MILVIVESPYAADTDEDIERNIRYARECIRDCLRRGEAPIASHLLYTQPGVLNDKVPAERELGIAAGLEWRRVSELSAFYTDLGWSPGMLEARELLIREARPWVERSLAWRHIEPGIGPAPRRSQASGGGASGQASETPSTPP